MIVTSIDFREILFRGVLLDCPSIKFYEEEDCINGLRKDNENRHLSIESLCHLIVRLLDWLNFYTRRSGMYFEFRRNNEFEGTLGKIVYNSNLQYRIDKIYHISICVFRIATDNVGHFLFVQFFYEICEILGATTWQIPRVTLLLSGERKRIQRMRVEKERKGKGGGRVICCTPLQRCHGDIKPIWFTSVKFDSLAWKQQAIINFSGATKDMAFHYKLLAARNPRRTHGVWIRQKISPPAIERELWYSRWKMLPLRRFFEFHEDRKLGKFPLPPTRDYKTDIFSFNTVDPVSSHAWDGITVAQIHHESILYYLCIQH